MVFYIDSKNRFIFLIEQLRASIISGISIEDSIKFISPRFSDYFFLNEIVEELNKNEKELSKILVEKIEKELDPDKKQFLESLNAGDFAKDKLAELQDNMLKKRNDNYETVASSITTKLGWLAFLSLIPVIIYFASGLTEVFKSVGFGDYVITNPMKIGIMAVCLVLFAIFIASKRMKNG